MSATHSCTFCRIVARESPSEVVYEDDHAFAFMDALPMTVGHTLLIPKAHHRDLMEIDPDVAANVMRAATKISRQIVDRLGARGINLLNNNGAAADQSQFHFHMHLIPRYGHDRLLHPWERMFGDWTEIRAAARRIRGETAG